MNDTGVAQQHLIAHQCQAMTHFQPRGVKSLKSLPPNLSQTHPICSHDTISVHAKLFQIIYMGPMNDTGVAQQHLIAHQCQAMTHFQPRGVISFALCLHKSEPNTPHLQP
jgi:hypothetical protein